MVYSPKLVSTCTNWQEQPWYLHLLVAITVTCCSGKSGDHAHETPASLRTVNGRQYTSRSMHRAEIFPRSHHTPRIQWCIRSTICCDRLTAEDRRSSCEICRSVWERGAAQSQIS